MSGWGAVRDRVIRSSSQRSMSKVYFSEIGEGVVRYSPATERASYSVTVRNGVVFHNESILNVLPASTTSSASWFKEVLRFAYVLAYDEHHKQQLYIHRHVVGQVHHSTSQAGRPVIDAGMMSILNGRIAYIESKSGHYKSNFEQTRHTLAFLVKGGVDLRKVYISRYVPTQCMLNPVVTPDHFDIVLENGVVALHLADDVFRATNFNSIPRVSATGDDFFPDVTRIKWV